MTSPFHGPTAGILVIGEEILSAKVEEENARYLVRELRGLGVAVRRIDVIPDEIDEIAEAVRGMSSRYDHVFTSGGVGPTHDDVTMAAVAKAFGLRPARNLELEAKIRSAMGSNLHPRDLCMADIPDGARLLYGPDGDRSRWPVVTVKNVYLLPGVPEIFRLKFEMVRELFRAGPIFESCGLFARERGRHRRNPGRRGGRVSRRGDRLLSSARGRRIPGQDHRRRPRRSPGGTCHRAPGGRPWARLSCARNRCAL
jgi:molybdenum cofactor synthesis domain-containing protein